MAEYSKMARGTFLYSGSGSKTIYLPFQPEKVKAYNTNQWANPVDGNFFSSYWDDTYVQGSSINEVYASTGLSAGVYQTAVYEPLNSITTFSYGIADIYGPQKQIVAATDTNPIVFTVTNHGYSNGDYVLFEGLRESPTTGMPQICGIPFSIVVTDTSTFHINWNGAQSNYTPLTISPAGAYVKKILDPSLYSPAVSFISTVSQGRTTTLSLTTPSNLSIGSIVSFRVPSIWKMIQLNSGQSNSNPGNTVYGKVIALGDAGYGYTSSVTVNINSTNFSTFNTNVPVGLVPGLSFPQMVAVGDVNFGGGQQIVNGVTTQNGPAVDGSFINNTRSGFSLGTLSILSSAAEGDSISWEAYVYDLVENL